MRGNEPNSFASRVILLRHIERLTQKELAKRINVSRSCLANYERGKRYPDRQTLEVIAGYFKVSVGYLTGEVGIGEVVNTKSDLSQKAKTLICEDWLDLGELSLTQRTSIRDYLEYLQKNELETEKL